jgi:CubicO group peptidase (beta-lactamase class C family)
MVIHVHSADEHTMLTDSGNEIYSKIAGHDSLSEDALPLQEDVVLRIASATKLITSIALLQCVEKGLVGLDEPLGNILPEIKDQKILTGVSGDQLILEERKNAITPRHLLSHMSGLGYIFTNPLLAQWGQSPARENRGSLVVTERFAMPLVFEPGNGWLYGCSLDWAGVVVSRLNGRISLEDYFIENIWKKLGLSSPFPRFNLTTHPEYNARAMPGVATGDDGKLKPVEEWPFTNPKDQDGGSGLASTTADYLAVLADLVSDSPKLLQPVTIAQIFAPQIALDSPAIPMLNALRPAWELVSGPVSEKYVNHGLGGLLLTGPVPEINQPGNILAWGGASNVVWFANRELGVAGFFATQHAPFGAPVVTKLVNAWKKDFWNSLNVNN